MLTVEDVEKIVAVQVAKLAPRFRTGVVATITGDATAGYSATVTLDNDAIHPTAAIRCYRHYSPVVGDRVDVIWYQGQPWRVLGKAN